ncbi:hypothetical protein CDAR_365911 [Caerostris darwini]|uniref:Uncharacterized protein n=1 Tax=Caerostris darwini TaxID=1538125 RepID=A0AAV4MRW7_9ARAC|nr:hypothetical protein CDAR_365911 [Caerostris darwini]
MFILALLSCIALTQASFYPSYPVSAPLVSNIPYSYGVVAPEVLYRNGRNSGYNSYVNVAGLGYNYGYNVRDNRFNDYAVGYDGYGYPGVLGYNGGRYGGIYYGLRK